MDKKSTARRIDVVDLEGDIVPAGAMVESKADAIHIITVLVIGLVLP